MLMESTGGNGEPVVGPKTFPSAVSDPEAARFPGLQRPLRNRPSCAQGRRPHPCRRIPGRGPRPRARRPAG